MRWKVVIGNLGGILKLFGFAFFVPVLPAIIYQEGPMAFGFLPVNVLIFLFMAAFTITLGYPFEAFGKAKDFYHNEAIVIVSVSWLMLALLSSIPFLLSGVLTSPIDGFFEAMSGMTTTGATVLPYPLEQHPKSVLLWRGLLQWMGGMGVIVLSVAILSKLSSGGLSLLEAEAPGPSITRLKPKIKETAKILWYIYGLLTLSEVILLLGAGVKPYDAVYHSFTTLATGGFSPHTSSIAYFSSTVQWIILFFMIVAGVNFSLHYQFFEGNFKKMFNNSEFRAYLFMIFGIATIVTFIVYNKFPSFGDSFRHSLFQVSALMTTTGYATVDFNQWPELARMFLLLLMFVGGSAGSTGGGMKVLRILLIFKMVGRKFKEFINPRRVLVVRLGDRVVNEGTLNIISMFFIAYLLIFAFGSLVMVGYGFDMISAISATATTLGNVGPGLGLVGPSNNFRAVPHTGRLFLALMMWIGRLEVFTAVVLFNPSLYKKKGLRKILKFRK
ncbi:MAG: TrkH family potassium uptake protein [Thermoplasmatota archaeon]